MLTKIGWISGILIATLIILSGLDIYLVYPILFLILGSLISRLNPKNKDNTGRNAIQVVANAGVAGILAIIHFLNPSSLLPVALVISFSIALADTFSSEIGKKYGGTPYSICSLRPTKNGLSGGISVIGTLGGLLGSLLISSSYYLLQHDLQNTIVVLTFGFLGMIVDSIIGCTLQAKYKEGILIRETGNKTDLINGYHFIGNNATNFLSILITVMSYLILSSTNN